MQARVVGILKDISDSKKAQDAKVSKLMGGNRFIIDSVGVRWVQFKRLPANTRLSLYRVRLF